MRFEIPTIVALLSSVATASPLSKLQKSARAFLDGRGTTLYKQQNAGGDGFAVPGGNGYCTDLDNIFGDYDGKVRSFVVEQGYQCEFFLNYGCPAYGTYSVYGNTTQSISVGSLNSTYDKKIHSVYCCVL